MTITKYLVQLEFGETTRWDACRGPSDFVSKLQAHSEHAARRYTTGSEPRVTVILEEAVQLNHDARIQGGDL